MAPHIHKLWRYTIGVPVPDTIIQINGFPKRAPHIAYTWHCTPKWPGTLTVFRTQPSAASQTEHNTSTHTSPMVSLGHDVNEYTPRLFIGTEILFYLRLRAESNVVLLRPYDIKVEVALI